jgi:hypothetical protein
MPFRRLIALAAMTICCVPAPAKDKKKNLLPADVLQARTVLVIIDPTAGVDPADPNANRLARVDVEQALDKWGRFQLVQERSTADLIIMVRKGDRKVIEPTIGGTPVNGTPPGNGNSTNSPNESTTRSGIRWGQQPGNPNDPSNSGTQPGTAYPQMEVGSTQDMFVVYRGDKDDSNWSPLDSPPVWRCTAKDALESPSVPAVEVFRKLVAESEKQLAASHP